MTQTGIFNRLLTKLSFLAAVFSLVLVQSAHAAIVSNGMGLVPCEADGCTINSVMQLFNNLQTFFFETLLLPIFVVMVMYLGYSYLTAGGNASQHAKAVSMARHMVLGLLLILCAWVIVRTILSILGFTDTFGFFG